MFPLNTTFSLRALKEASKQQIYPCDVQVFVRSAKCFLDTLAQVRTKGVWLYKHLTFLRFFVKPVGILGRLTMFLTMRT